MKSTTANSRETTGDGRDLNRRGFMQKATGAAGALTLPSLIPASAWGGLGQTPPSNRITVAQIGLGTMGQGHVRRLSSDPSVELVALCDVDRMRLIATQAAVSQTEGNSSPDIYNDYQDVLARDDIDAVVIVTPDHWHTPMAIDAAKAGKDIYCEKPVSMTVREGRVLEEAVRRCNRIFQTGTQYRSIPAIREVCNFVRNGGLGKVKSVFTLWRNMAGYLRNRRFQPYREFLDLEAASRSYVPLDVSLPAEPVPEGLDWNRWVGPAPWHGYNRLFHTNPKPGVVPWSFCREFGVGASTGYHSHAADIIQYALGMERSGPVELLHPNDGPYPTLTCRYANGTLLHLIEDWQDVKRLYQAVPDSARLAGNFGGVFVGEKGWITSMTTGGPIEGGPREMMEGLPVNQREPAREGNNHQANWLHCIRTRQRPSTDAELGHRAATLGHLTIVAYQLGRSLTWNPAAEKFPHDSAANRLLSRASRG
ncbi:Gfo/Idh/MocA family protein [Novipirellula artificiosorum]|uniref:Inositol 2-dehydrogenase n=1 Tax=Novipirellula artificiosorum TaxID=2528016 RepID=A0A5C6D8R0_9BACT|nr:Gfo/Idh/MocA family oxidoreductase [Novipirellula artificiosorum]TWU33230.1 Inositol 2-dehydrogenase [Novipirellula artificiosorum]